MKETKIQWHPGFVAAINLELRENRNDLLFEKEYNLNTKPLEIDLLVIKKNPGAWISNEIGQLFRGHNILEYKSPEDHLDIDTFYKTGAYASLYKAYGKSVDDIKADDVTVSLIRESRPEGLFQYFEEHGFEIENPFPGIYYIKGRILFPTQLIITKELDKREHVWLGALSDRLKKRELADLLETVRRLTGKTDRELADSVLEVSVGANRQVMEELMGDDAMCQALMEIMEPQIVLREKKATKEGWLEGRQEGRQEGIKSTIEVLRDFGHSNAEIKRAIMEKYSLSPAEAEAFL